MQQGSGSNYAASLPRRRTKTRAFAKNGYVNEVRDYLASFGPSQSGGETHRSPAPVLRTFMAIIWDAGPNGEANWTDRRYWLKVKGASGSGTDIAAEAVLVDDGVSMDNQLIILATNITETFSPLDSLLVHKLLKNTPVRVFLEIDVDGLPRYVFHREPFPRLIPVNLTQDGGSDGNTSTKPTYTYTATDADDALIGYGAGIAYDAGNRTNGETDPATRGTLHIKTDGTAELWDCNEKPATVGPCT